MPRRIFYTLDFPAISCRAATMKRTDLGFPISGSVSEAVYAAVRRTPDRVCSEGISRVDAELALLLYVRNAAFAGALSTDGLEGLGRPWKTGRRCLSALLWPF